MKKCTKCQKEKELYDFYKRAESKDGYRAQCIECTKLGLDNEKRKHSQNNPCDYCGELCWSKKKTNRRCEKCKIKHSREKMSKLTIGEKTYTKHKYAKYSYIRFHAKQLAKELNWTKCKKCGYDKHVEICHIKPVASYPENTTLEVINSIDNLLPLCPNCHWEFDNLKNDGGGIRTQNLSVN